MNPPDSEPPELSAWKKEMLERLALRRARLEAEIAEAERNASSRCATAPLSESVNETNSARLAELKASISARDLAQVEEDIAKGRPSPFWDNAAILSLCLVSVAMLLTALFGKPPYPFFAYLKWTVGLTCILSAWHLVASHFWVIAVPVAASGLVQMFGSFSRSDWTIPNWITITLLLIVAIVQAVGLSIAGRLRKLYFRLADGQDDVLKPQ